MRGDARLCDQARPARPGGESSLAARAGTRLWYAPQASNGSKPIGQLDPSNLPAPIAPDESDSERFPAVPTWDGKVDDTLLSGSFPEADPQVVRGRLEERRIVATNGTHPLKRLRINRVRCHRRRIVLRCGMHELPCYRLFFGVPNMRTGTEEQQDQAVGEASHDVPHLQRSSWGGDCDAW